MQEADPGDRHFHRYVLESMRSGVISVSRAGEITCINDNALRMLQIEGTPEEFLGKAVQHVLRDHAYIGQLLLESFKSKHLPNRAEMVIRGPGREGKNIGFTLSLVRDDAGEVIGAAIFFKDLTQIEQLEEGQRLKERLAALGQMAAGLAHEIRNPLAGIEVMAGLLRRRLLARPQVPPEVPREARADSGKARADAGPEVPSPEVPREARADSGKARADSGPEVPSKARADSGKDDATQIDAILSEVHRLNGIVSDCLDFVRPLGLNLVPVQVETLLEEALGSVEKHWEEQGIRVWRRYGAGIPWVPADPRSLRQVLLNLLVNAAQAIQIGGEGEGGTVTVTTGVTPVDPDARTLQLTDGRVRLEDIPPEREEHVRIEIADDGCGIDPETLDKIFYPFFTTKEKGSGIGLAVAQKIIDEHRGFIDVESTRGLGTRFIIKLPLRPKR